MISVIIPVLNGECFLSQCLKSVINQSIHDIEIIIVDAGSTDGTMNIIASFMEIDSRIILLHSDRKSYGAQMNIGIKNAKGKYLAILEADDILPLDAYEILLDKMEQTGADIVKGNYENFISSYRGDIITIPTNIFKNNPNVYGKIITAKEYTEIIRKDRYIWQGLYDMDFIRSNGIIFNETAGAAFQDNGFLIQTLILAKKIIYLERNVYCYRKDNNESSVYSAKGFKYIADEYLFIMDFINKIQEDEKMLYLPLIYLTIMDLVRTRCMLRSTLDINNESINFDDINRIVDILKDSLPNSIAGYDIRTQKDLFEIELLCRDPHLYLEYTQKEVLAERHDVECFFDRVLNYKEIYVWGYGQMGSMFRALLDRKKYDGKIFWSDVDPRDVAGIKIENASDLALKYSGDGVYVICATNYRYEIREELHDRYNVPYNKIVFYTIGAKQQLFFM